MSNQLRSLERAQQKEKRKKKVQVKNLDMVLVNFDDKPIIELGDGGQKTSLTFRRAVIMALGGRCSTDNGPEVTARQFEHCYDLMVAIKSANGEVEVSAEDISLIKERVKFFYPPMTTGQICKLLEGKVPAFAQGSDSRIVDSKEEAA